MFKFMRYVLCLLLLPLISIGLSFAETKASVVEVSLAYDSCNPAESKDINYYLSPSRSSKPADSYWDSTNNLGVIPRNGSSKIEVWRNGVIFQCNDWNYPSNFFPKSTSSDKYDIFQNTDSCKFSIPNYIKTHSSQLDAQIHYVIGTSKVVNSNTQGALNFTTNFFSKKSGAASWICGANGVLTVDPVSCPVSTKYYTPVVDSHLGECLNYRVFRCGDGLINGRNGSTKYDNGTFTEACDPNAPGWSRTTCDPQTCQPINEPQGNGSIEKTLIGDGIVTKTGDIVTWKITVTASGGSIKDFEIKDKLPAELAYESYVPFKVPSGITVNPPTGTTTKIITWKVDGTLKEGETIELEVITKVVKMPVYNQKVENVACLVIAGREKCDPGYIGTPSIEKTLIGSGIVSHTGETLIWEITARPNGGFIEDFQFIENFVIVDGVPVQLKFVDYQVVHTPSGVSVSAPTITPTSTGTLVKWNVSGKVMGDEYVKIRVITEVVIMPKPGEVITNMACLVIDPEREVCDEATTTAEDPGLWIRKTFSDGSTESKIVKIGDHIGYKISFGNSGKGIASVVSLRDFLPQNLKYISSQIFLSTNSSHSSGTQEGVFIDRYGNMTLDPGVEGYVMLTGEVLSSSQDSRYNKACIYLDEREIACDGVIYELREDSNLKIQKSVNKSEVDKIGDTVVFTLIVTNIGKTPMSGFTVTDTLPNGLSFDAEGTANGFSFSQNGKTLTWSNYQYTLQPGESTTITFTARVESIGSHRNVVCLTHPQFPDRGSYPYVSTNCDDAYVKVKEKNYCVAPETDKTFYTTNSQGKVNVPVTCRSPNGEATIVIDCGNGDIYSDTNVSALSRSCGYAIGNSTSKTYTISCKVNGETKDETGRFCSKDITLENYKDKFGYCGDGSATHWEDCDCGNDSKECSTSSKYVDFNTDRLTKPKIDEYRNGDYMCKNCKIVDDGEYLVTPMACFNVNNGSISINKGEMLPFYWNIEKIDDKYYTEVDNYDNSESLLAYDKLAGKSCAEDDNGKIPLNAMVCNFMVYNGKNLQSEGKYVYSLRVPCFTKGTDIQPDWTNSSLISSFIDWNKNNYIKDGNANGGNTFWSYNITSNSRDFAFRSSVFIIDNFGRTSTNGRWITKGNNEWDLWAEGEVKSLGEYKLSLDSVEYLQCNGGKWQKQDPYPRVCEVNFSVTEPYILQKTPSGTISKTTEDLSTYHMYADGTKTFDGYIKDSLVNSSDYSDVKGRAKQAFDNFYNKYQKLAVKVEGTMFGSTTVKKVPGKNIYFVEGDLTIDGYYYLYDKSKTRKEEKRGNNAVYDKPFTIVQVGGNTTIKGNLNHNMMLLTNGTITFDGSLNCNDAQVVRGIFYTTNADGFKSIRVQKNDDLKNQEWCIGGGLHIKGVAIGNGLETLMKERRSELNRWFYGQSTAQQKRKYIMDGAAVLIEYSPSVFTTATMPPGAEEFTTALEVYRK